MEQDRKKQGTDLMTLVSTHRRGIMGVAAIFIYLFHKHSLIFTGRTLSMIEYRSPSFGLSFSRLAYNAIKIADIFAVSCIFS